MIALAREGLLFTQLYATGTRTVRGLEALALSLPPTPGHSVVKRPNNDHLFTVGEVFAEKGYEPLYLYGGYGYFDNMEHFFGGNGYTVIDRTALDKADIHYENIWGVADEDLFTLTLRELDQAPRRRHEVLCARDDDIEPSSLYLPGGPHRHSAEDRRRWRREVHRLGDRRLHRARAQACLVRRHGVRHRRRPLRGLAWQDRPAARPLPHPAADLRAEAHRSGAHRHDRIADRRRPDGARAAEFQLCLALLRAGHPERRPYAPACA